MLPDTPTPRPSRVAAPAGGPTDWTGLLWQTLAERYQDEPAVLFDLFNEPHDVPASSWHDAARYLIDLIRPIHPRSLLFVSGMDWGYDSQ